MNIKFSIITVCFNSDKTIINTINSVKNQTYKNYEHILVDGLSTDKTLDIIKEYQSKSEKVYFISEKDNGIYDAMNKGIDLATGDLILFLNSDDTLDLKALEYISKNYEESYDIIFGDTYHIDKYNNKIFEKKIFIDEKNYKEKLEMIPHTSMFVKRNIMKNNKFDTSYKICADYKLVLQMYKKNMNFKYVKVRINNMLRGGTSTSQLKENILENIRCQKEVLGFSNININKCNRKIRIENFCDKLLNILGPNLYVKLRYIKRGWKESKLVL